MRACVRRGFSVAEVERITISLDTLRNELAQLELRLIDRLQAALVLKADQSIVGQHDERLKSLELTRAQREGLPGEVHDLDLRVGVLETDGQRRGGERDFRRWLLPAFVSCVGAGWWIPVLLHH